MKAKKMLAIVVLALGLIVCQAEVSEAVPMGTAFTYQGRLMDANSAAEGLYDLQFELYSDPCLSFAAYKVGGTVTIDDLDVFDGYFTVELDFGTWGVFTGDARWLQVGVRPGDSDDTIKYTFLGPRQELTPTPYALYAASGPGVPVPLVLTGSSPDAIISGTNFGAGSAVYGKATNTGEEDNHGGYFESAGSDSSGVYGKATGLWGHGVYGTATSSKGRGVYGRASGQDGMGVYGYASNMGDVTNYGGYFLARGEQGRGVYGEASNAGNLANYGGYFVARGKYGRAVYAEGTGESSRGVWGETSGKYGIGVQGTASGDNSFGVYGFTSGSSGTGVYGYAFKTGDVENYGGYFTAAGSTGRGVYGYASDTGVVYNYGGYFDAAGERGRGVYGYASNAGPTRNYGGYFEAEGTTGVGVYGKASGYGGYFKTAGDGGRAVFGLASGSEDNYGGWFKALGSSGVGVYGEATGSYGRGVEGLATSKHGQGVYGKGMGSNGYGVVGHGQQYDFFAVGPGGNYGVESSIRWKSNVRTIDDPLEKVMNLRGVYFNWDAEHGGAHDVGMIAEEVGRIVPEIVSYEENGIDATGMDYSKLTPLLVEAVKDLNTKLDQQQELLAEKTAEIAAQQAQIQDLQKDVAQLTGLVKDLVE